jgi:integrase
VSKKAADEHFRKVSADQGYDPTGGKESFKVWSERYLLSKEGVIKPSTMAKTKGILDRSVLPEFGHRRIDSIKTADIKAYTDRLRIERGLSPATVRHHFLVVSGVLGHATDNNAIPINPAKGCKLPTDKTAGRIKPEVRPLSAGEVAALENALNEQDPDTPYGLLCTFLAYTGLRVSEASGLVISDLNTMTGVLTVRRTLTKVRGGWAESNPKNGEPRKVRLPSWLSLRMAAYLGEHPHKDDPAAPLWPGRRTADAERFKHAKGGLDWSRPWDRDAFYKRHFKPALKLAGLPANVRLHDLRHSCASILRRNGVPIEHISKQLGHKSVIITQTIYTHIWDDDTANFMDTIPEPVPSVGGGGVTLLHA